MFKNRAKPFSFACQSFKIVVTMFYVFRWSKRRDYPTQSKPAPPRHLATLPIISRSSSPLVGAVPICVTFHSRSFVRNQRGLIFWSFVLRGSRTGFTKICKYGQILRTTPNKNGKKQYCPVYYDTHIYICLDQDVKRPVCEIEKKTDDEII